MLQFNHWSQYCICLVAPVDHVSSSRLISSSIIHCTNLLPCWHVDFIITLLLLSINVIDFVIVCFHGNQKAASYRTKDSAFVQFLQPGVWYVFVYNDGSKSHHVTLLLGKQGQSHSSVFCVDHRDHILLAIVKDWQILCSGQTLMSLSSAMMFFFRVVSCLPVFASPRLFLFRRCVAFFVSFCVLLYVLVSSSDPLQFYMHADRFAFGARVSFRVCWSAAFSFNFSFLVVVIWVLSCSNGEISCSNSCTISAFVDGFSVAFPCFKTFTVG